VTGGILLFLVVGLLFAVTGLGMLIAAFRGGNVGENKRSTGLLIAGMMVLAFGMILTGFAIAFATTKPYDFDTAASA